MTVPLILTVLLASWTELGAMRRLVCGPLMILHSKSSEAELAPLAYWAVVLVDWHQPGVQIEGRLELANLAVPPNVTVMSTSSPFVHRLSLPAPEIWMSVMWRGTSWPRLPEVRVTGMPGPV